MPSADVASFLSRVQMPTVQHLLNGSLEPARAAIRATIPERDSQQWIALHMILGTALRLRASRMPADERAVACVEAVRAFECALAECCERKHPRLLGGASGETSSLSLQTSSCMPGPDGVQMVVDATTVPMTESISLLERAIRVLRDAAEGTDRRTELRAWVVARSNLGCALTLLGQRTLGMGSVQRLEQAIDTLSEAAQACSANELLEERASIHVNLSEAFQTLAYRGMPAERLRHLERSLDWIAAALGFFAPEEYQWLLELDGAAVA